MFYAGYSERINNMPTELEDLLLILEKAVTYWKCFGAFNHISWLSSNSSFSCG